MYGTHKWPTEPGTGVTVQDGKLDLEKDPQLRRAIKDKPKEEREDIR